MFTTCNSLRIQTNFDYNTLLFYLLVILWTLITKENSAPKTIDQRSMNYANIRQRAWWYRLYNYSHESNLNGIYGKVGSEIPSGIIWESWKNYYPVLCNEKNCNENSFLLKNYCFNQVYFTTFTK